MIKNKFLLVLVSIFLIGWWLVRSFEIPAHDERVTDLADLFTDEQEAALETQLQGLETAHQAEVAVVTLPSLEWDVIESWSVKIAEARGVGKESVDNGVLIAIAPNEKKRRIEVWYGLEWDIPDITAWTLGRNILVPAFREGQYYEWVSTLVEALSWIIAWVYYPELDEEVAVPQDTLGEKFVIGLMMVIFLSIFVSSFAKWIVESRTPKPTSKTKKKIWWWWSIATTLLWIAIAGALGIIYLLPAFLIWRLILLSPSNSRWNKWWRGGWTSWSGWSGWSWWGWGSSFGWFGWGSFGWWGAWWTW